MKKYLIFIIFLLALVLRVVNLNNYPIGFTPDEASFGYDAYSLLKTGKDQWGKSLPLVLESFGDYKSPLYAYLSLPFVAIFDLTKYAVRLPNALLGSFSVLVVYFLTRKLFKNEKAGLWASLLLAISPWHIMMSRGAFEANLTTFFLPLGILLFANKKYVFAGLVLGLNLFTYHSAKFVTPLVLVSYLILFWSEIKKINFRMGVGLGVFGVFVFLTAYTMFIGAGARVAERSITQGALEEAFLSRKNLVGTNLYQISRFFHNKYVVSGQRFVDNYVTYLSPQFLFSKGPNEGTYGMLPGVGVYYWFVIPFIFFLRKLFFEDSKDQKSLLFLFSWMLFSVIPASLATGAGYSANRAVVMLPSFEILLGVGAYYFFTWLRPKKLLVGSYGVFIFVSVIFFLESYFVQSKYLIASDMLYGRLEAVQWLSQNTSQTDKIVVDKSLSEPHMYFAFANQTDPTTYQTNASKNWDYSSHNVNWVDQIPEYRLNNLYFEDIKQAGLKEGGVFVGKPSDFPSDIVASHTINYPNGQPAIFIVKK